ncbi:MAG: ankyrin repeat domain-containing protein [Candidatus Babeliaceae bacterium]|jgi:cytohesin
MLNLLLLLIVSTSIQAGGNIELIDAVIKNDLHTVKTLLHKKTDPNIQNNSGNTPLHYNALLLDGFTEITSVLLKHNANPDIQNKNGQTPLHYLSLHHCKTPEQIAVMEILLAAGANPNLQDLNGLTSLHGAVYNNQTEVVKALLNKGARLDMQGSNTSLLTVSPSWFPAGTTPLHMSKNSTTTQLLLSAGAQVDAQDADGESPLHKATKKHNTQQIAELIDHGANIFIKDTYHNTPMHIACNLSRSWDDNDLTMENKRFIVKLFLYHAWQKELLPTMDTTKNKNGVTPPDLIRYPDATFRTLVKDCIAQKPYAIKEIITAGAKVEYEQFAKKTRQKNVLLALRTRELTGKFDKKRF